MSASKRNNFVWIFIVFATLFFFAILTVIGIVIMNEKTIIVPDEVGTISGAVSMAEPGDIILVKVKENGTPYNESFTINQDKIKLIGIGKEKPVIDSPSIAIRLNTTSGVLVRSFDFQGNSIAIQVLTSESNMIKDNSFIDNSLGITLSDSDRNILKGNTSSGNSNPISLSFSNNNLINGNTLNNDSANGINLSNSDGNLIKRNTVTNIGFNGILLNTSSNDNDVFFNRAFGNGDGVVTFDINDEGNPGTNNNLKGNKCDTSSPEGLCK
ncbi:NosD domain-containing protein [Bacillus spongiae]|uniref:NosD domain-containing protein n=1 Tax=Bacillus spongiae TaxID=2683610 RepID=A0ABU8HBG5_9BACI